MSLFFRFEARIIALVKGRHTHAAGPPPDMAAALRGLARLLAPFIREELAGEEREEWISHRRSPLGARRTRELARRGAFPGAKRHSRNWLIPRAELNAYIEREGLAPPAAPLDTANGDAPAEDDDRDLRATLHEHGLEPVPQRARPARSRRS
jgi:hypothetical protein